MKYHIDTKYAWYISETGEQIVLLYLLKHSFYIDELPEIVRSCPEVIDLIKDEKDGHRRNVQIFKLSYDGRMSPNAV